MEEEKRKRKKILLLCGIVALGLLYGAYSWFFSGPDITGGDREASFALKWLEKAFNGKAAYCFDRASGAFADNARIERFILDCRSLGDVRKRALKIKKVLPGKDGECYAILFDAAYPNVPSIEERIEVATDKNGNLTVRAAAFVYKRLPTRFNKAKPLEDPEQLNAAKQAAETWLDYYDKGDTRPLGVIATRDKRTVNVGVVDQLTEFREKHGAPQSRSLKTALVQSGIPGETALELAYLRYDSRYADGVGRENIWLKRDPTNAETARWVVYDYAPNMARAPKTGARNRDGRKKI